MKIYLANRLVSISNEIISMFPATLKGQENEKVSQESQATILNSLGNMTRELEALGLPFTKLAAGRFAMDLPNMKGDDCEKAFDDLNQRFQDEVGNIRFFYVSPNKMAYFDQSSAFGPQVLERFPSAEYDVKEAANCFALSRHTASVMHCMRVLEAGLDSLAAALKVRRSAKGWGADLSIFSDAWQNRLKATPKLPGWQRTFFPQAFADFRHFAGAWRNYAMHGKAKYGEEEAHRVFEHVRTFMQQLAGRFREKKPRQP
jgi:hypothetical protein